MSINNSKCFDFFYYKSESNINDLKHLFLHFFRIPKTQSYGYEKCRISNPSRKRGKKIPNFILNLIDTYRNIWKIVLDESHIYDLKGGLLYLLRSTLQFGIKNQK
jgi:hypothetical protein